MPTNLYGTHDNFDLEEGHVLPAMINKYHTAKQTGYFIDNGGPWHGNVTLWGDGSACREFLHVDDLAEACYVCMENYDSIEIINVGTGEDVSIKELASLVARVVDFPGDTDWDKTKPNGTPRKLLDVTKIKSLGWNPTISLKQGITQTYEWFLTC
jgi:GDP-L-fucose synthase